MEHHRKLIELKWRRYKVDAIPLESLEEGKSYLLVVKTALTMNEFITMVPEDLNQIAKFFRFKLANLYNLNDPMNTSNISFTFYPSSYVMGADGYGLSTYSRIHYLEDWICLDKDYARAKGDKDLYEFDVPQVDFTDNSGVSKPSIFEQWGDLQNKPLGPIIGPPQTGYPIITDHTAPYREEQDRHRRNRDQDFEDLLNEISRKRSNKGK